MTFAELVALMVLGTGAPDSVVGVVRHSSPEDGEWTRRVWRRGELVRYETVDGRVQRIVGSEHEWIRYAGEDEFTAFSRDGRRFGSPIGGLEPGGERPSFSRWDGTDFTRPTGPPTTTTFLDRECWEIELAPPRHKPYPIQVTVDAATGLVLRDANREFGSVTEFTEVEIGVAIPDERFVWDGPALAEGEQDARRNAAHERELAERRVWLASRGLVADLPLAPDIVLHEWSDDTGAFFASLSVRAEGSLARGPLDDPPEPQLAYPHLYRWTDTRWSWVLGSTNPIADEQLALVQVQLAKST